MKPSRILIVEDEAVVAMNIEERLEALGYELAGSVASGEEALALVPRARPDLILMDIRLQGAMDGITAAEEIREQFHLPVIFLTAYSEDGTLERAKRAEPYGYILKPFDDRELKSTVEIALYKHAAEQEILRLNRLYDLLSQVNQTIVRLHSREEMLADVCRLVVERGKVDLAWIAALDPDSSRISPVACFGSDPAMLSGLELLYADERPEGQGDPGRAIHEEKPFICNECSAHDCLYPSSSAPARFGFQSCGSFPIRFQGRVWGALTLCVKEPGFFRERESGLIQEVAMDISFALEQLESEARRERAESALRAGEAKFRSYVEHAPIGIFVIDRSGRCVEVNSAGAEMLGYTHDEILGLSILDALAPEDRDAGLRNFQTVVEKGFVASEHLFRRKDSTPTWVSVRAVRLDDNRFLALCQDITERKLAEESLREKEAFIRTVLDNLPVGIAVSSLDSEVKFEYMNDKFPAFYRTTRESLANPDAFWEAVYEDPRFREEIKARVHADCASGDPDRMLWEDVKITRKGSKTAFITARNIPLPDKPLMISTVWDVTERKSLEAQLLQAQRMEAVGRLAGGVAHDYNNILGIIVGYAELALTKIAPSDPLCDDLGEIMAAARRSTEITRQLLAFARRQTIAPVVLDLGKTVEGMLKMLRRLIGEDINLAWAPKVYDWYVMMDPAQIDQILANLCINARDAISGVGKITIETGKVTFDEAYCADHLGFIPGEFVMLAVSDNGCGMDRETLEHLFEPFFTTKGMGKGTGLGMSTVYGIVKQNNGFINVYSEPGKGSTFRVYLPRHTGGAITAETVVRREPSRGRGETILLVEDEQAFLNMGKTMLERLGYRVLAAAGPTVAMELASEHAGEIRLVITDVVMPDMNGRDLSERLHALHPNLKCLFMSGYTANAIAHRGVLDEGVRFIQKPFSLEELAAKVREALD